VTSFSAAYFKRCGVNLNFDHWLNNCVGKGLDLDKDQLRDFVSRIRLLNESKLEQYYTVWQKSIRGELYLSKKDNAEKFLALLMPKLSGLVGIRCSSKTGRIGTGVTVPSIELISLGSIAQELMCEPTMA
jgi:hypothetical protein